MSFPQLQQQLLRFKQKIHLHSKQAFYLISYFTVLDRGRSGPRKAVSATPTTSGSAWSTTAIRLRAQSSWKSCRRRRPVVRT